MRYVVSFAGREPVEVEANEVEFLTAGGIAFRQVEYEERTNPQDFRQRVRVAVGATLAGAWSADAGWTSVLPLEADDATSPLTAEEYAIP